MPISGQPIGGGGQSLLYSLNTWVHSQSFSSAVYANSGMQITGEIYGGGPSLLINTASDGFSPTLYVKVTATNGANLQSLDGQGNHVVAGSATSGGPSHNNSPQTTLAGTTAGDVYWVQDEQGTVKRFVAVFSGYENDTVTSQTITFPTAYTRAAVVSANNTGLTITASLTSLTITAPNSTALFNGVVEVTGI